MDAICDIGRGTWIAGEAVTAILEDMGVKMSHRAAPYRVSLDDAVDLPTLRPTYVLLL